MNYALEYLSPSSLQMFHLPIYLLAICIFGNIKRIFFFQEWRLSFNLSD